MKTIMLKLADALITASWAAVMKAGAILIGIEKPLAEKLNIDSLEKSFGDAILASIKDEKANTE